MNDFLSGLIEPLSIRPSQENNFVSEMQTVKHQADPNYNTIYLIDVVIASQNINKPLQIRMENGWKIEKGTRSTAEAVDLLLKNSSASNGRKFRSNGRGSNSPFKKETPMSFCSFNNCYLILRLQPDSALRFSSEHSGFSFDSELDENNFKFVRRIKEDHTLVEDIKETSDVDGNGRLNWPHDCRMLIVAYDASVTPTATIGQDIFGSARFNLHIDVLSDPADQEGSYIPIIVDPDVRFPGGNEGP